MADDPTGLRAQLDLLNQQNRNLRAELGQAKAHRGSEWEQSVRGRIEANERTFRGVQKALRDLTRKDKG